MTKLLWDKTGEKVYETGVDRGVLYLADNTGVVWNGLTSVSEDYDNLDVTPYYVDGVKYFNERSVGEYSATLKAFTYPDEFLEYDGFQSATIGMFVDEQPVTKKFGLSYRTGVGNDVEGNDLGYKIHVVYNLTATPSSKSYNTISSGSNPVEFSWDITGTPKTIPGFRPTAHAILDTRLLLPAVVEELEAILYGTSTTNARIPTLSELMNFIFNVVDNGNGTWTATGSDEIIQYLDATTFQINWPGAVMINSTSYTLSNN